MSRYRRTDNPWSRTPRPMMAKYAGPCACCGAQIKAGEMVTYYPAGVSGNGKGAIAHLGGLDGNSPKCSAKIAEQMAINQLAGDGLDARYEDDCAARCGL